MELNRARRRRAEYSAIMFVSLMCALSILPAATCAQGTQDLGKPARLITARPTSVEHQYWHILMWQVHLDKVAAERQKKGEDAVWLRNYIQNKLLFSDYDYAPIREAAERLGRSLSDTDTKAHAVISQYRGHKAAGTATSDERLSSHAQLRSLDEQRETTINNTVVELDQVLGPEHAAKFRNYIEKHYGPSDRPLTPPLKPAESIIRKHLSQGRNEVKP